MIRAHQPGSEPIDIPETIPNPVVVPKPTPTPTEPAPKEPVRWLAQKETRDYDRQQRLLEVAGFYRSLAGIIPAMPTQYKIKIGPSLTRAERTPALNYRRHSHGSSWGLGVWVITLAIRGHMLELLGINVVRMKKH